MLKPISIVPTLIYLVILSLAVGLLAPFLHFKGTSINTLIFIYYILVLAYGVYSVILYQKNYDIKIPAIISVALVSTGPFGIIGSFIFFLVSYLYKLRNITFDNWYHQLFPSIHLAKPNEIYDRIKAGWDDYLKKRDVEPLYNMFICGDLSIKQEVIELIAQNYYPPLSKLLRLALTDKSNTVRVQSASIISHIKKVYEYNYEEAKTESQQAPMNHALSRKMLLYLFDLLDSNILDEITYQEYLYDAYPLCEHYLKQNPDDIKIMEMFFKVLFYSQHYDMAKKWVDDKIGITRLTQEMLPYYLEILYRLKEYTLFEEKLRSWYPHANKAVINEDLKSTLDFWTQSHIDEKESS